MKEEAGRAEREALFEDQDFPSDDTSLFSDSSTPIARLQGQITWQRPQVRCSAKEGSGNAAVYSWGVCFVISSMLNHLSHANVLNQRRFFPYPCLLMKECLQVQRFSGDVVYFTKKQIYFICFSISISIILQPYKITALKTIL